MERKREQSGNFGELRLVLGASGSRVMEGDDGKDTTDVESWGPVYERRAVVLLSIDFEIVTLDRTLPS